MAHTNSTPNYQLPQFLATDKPAWMTDVNPAYVAIDTGMKNAQDTANSAQADATQALSDASSASTAAASADAKGSGAIASVADSFDTTATYTVGELVVYNNLLYKCTTAVTTPGPWTGSTNWSRTTIETELNINNDAIDFEIIESVDSVTGVNWTAKKYNNGDLEVWGHKKYTPAEPIAFGSWGSTFLAVFDNGTWPVTFIDVPMCIGQVQIENVGCISSTQAAISTTHAPQISALRGIAGTIDTSFHINQSIYAKGRWRV